MSITNDNTHVLVDGIAWNLCTKYSDVDAARVS